MFVRKNNRTYCLEKNVSKHIFSLGQEKNPLLFCGGQRARLFGFSSAIAETAQSTYTAEPRGPAVTKPGLQCRQPLSNLQIRV